jgi:aspartyl-tRNA(Asn)/glutamyl-tRNA(Gln) amidotransferase subunit A
VELYLADVMTVSANLADLPAVSVPVGVGAIEPGSTVAPVGMQLMGARQNEFGVLRAAAAMEWYADHRMRQIWPWTQ